MLAHQNTFLQMCHETNIKIQALLTAYVEDDVGDGVQAHIWSHTLRISNQVGVESARQIYGEWSDLQNFL